jgi:hypothetical protein
LEIPFVDEIDIVRLEVPVDHALAVHRVERVENLHQDAHRGFERQHPALHETRQARPLEILHDDEGTVLEHPHVGYLYDVVVPYAGRRSRLVVEPLDDLGMGGDLGKEKLDCQIPPDEHVPRLVDDAHAPFSDNACKRVLAFQDSAHLPVVRWNGLIGGGAFLRGNRMVGSAVRTGKFILWIFRHLSYNQAHYNFVSWWMQ